MLLRDPERPLRPSAQAYNLSYKPRRACFEGMGPVCGIVTFTDPQVHSCPRGIGRTTSSVYTSGLHIQPPSADETTIRSK